MKLEVALALALSSMGALWACGGSTPEPAAAPAAPVEAATPPAPGPALLVVQAWFKVENKSPKPQAARLLIVRPDAGGWKTEELLDPESDVFHKAVAWRDGVLTIGGTAAHLKHWTRGPSGWTARTLWTGRWNGKFNRLRDLELADLNGDGREEIVIATHDQGVVAVGTEVEDAWTFREFDEAPDTFVHEIEIGDVDGDGQREFYATPSGRNRASGESQPGAVVRYDPGEGGAWARSEVVAWGESHAKEILVSALGGPKDRLFAVREGHTEKDEAGQIKIVDPVRIVELVREGSAWVERPVASLQDRQCRFLLPADLDGDGLVDLVAAGWKSGLWWLRATPAGGFEPSLIRADSGGFEHATHAADLDGDGRVELYVAADEQGELRQIRWEKGAFVSTTLATIPPLHITWNVQDGTL